MRIWCLQARWAPSFGRWATTACSEQINVMCINCINLVLNFVYSRAILFEDLLAFLIGCCREALHFGFVEQKRIPVFEGRMQKQTENSKA